MQLTFSASSRNRDTPMQQLIHYFTPPFEKSKCGIGKKHLCPSFCVCKSKRRGRPEAGFSMISGIAWNRPLWRQKKKRMWDSKGLCHLSKLRAKTLFVSSKVILFSVRTTLNVVSQSLLPRLVRRLSIYCSKFIYPFLCFFIQVYCFHPC